MAEVHPQVLPQPADAALSVSDPAAAPPALTRGQHEAADSVPRNEPDSEEGKTDQARSAPSNPKGPPSVPTEDHKKMADKKAPQSPRKPRVTTSVQLVRPNGPPTRKGGAFAVKAALPPSKSMETAMASPTSSFPSATFSLQKSTSARPPPKDSKSPVAGSAPKPGTASSTSIHARRTSLAPTSAATHPITKSISSPGKTSASPTKTSAVSPTASDAAVRTSAPAKPRASVSEGVKKLLPSSRHSIVPNMRPMSTASTSAVSPKPSRPASTVREVKGDGKALQDAQSKLKEATDSLASQAEIVAGLEGKLEQLTTSFEATSTELEAKRSSIVELEKAKQASEGQLADVKVALQKSEAERQTGEEQLQTVQKERDGANVIIAELNERTQALEALKTSLEGQVSNVQGDLAATKASSEASNLASAQAFAIEHEALVKAKADYDAIAAEAEALNAAHTQALEEATAKLAEISKKDAELKELRAGLALLKTEKEQDATRICELEVKILETKEAQEKAEDDRMQSLTRVKTLVEELARAASAAELTAHEWKAKEDEHNQRLIEREKSHDAAIAAASKQRAHLEGDIESLKAELVRAQAEHEQTKLEAQSAAEGHAQKLETAEHLYLAKQTELFEEIKRVTDELEDQEKAYNSMVDALKVEQARLLEETFTKAFVKAKTEASAEHSKDLQALRAESQVSIEQLQSAHHSTIDEIKAQHAAILDSQAKDLEKRLSNQLMELKATQDDLSKAKASLAAAHAEIENIQAQRDAALKEAADIAASRPPGQAEEIKRLKKALVDSEDEKRALQESRRLTQLSMEEAATNHSKDLEQAAQGRVEEVKKLQARFEEESQAWKESKSKLLTKISDLEGELAAKTAALEAEAAAVKTNGAVRATSPDVTEAKLQDMDQAHNLVLHDMQAEHDKALAELKEELEKALETIHKLNDDVARKMMEIQYLELEQDDKEDEITKLKEELNGLKSKEAEE